MEDDTTTLDSPIEQHRNSCFPPSQRHVSDFRSLVTLTRTRLRIPTVNIPTYVWCTVYTAIGGFLFGFDTGSIGPITVMSQFQHHFFGGAKISPIIQGLIVSSILITASVSSFLSGPLANRISRTRTICLGAITFSVGSAIACSSKVLAQLFVGRCIAGVGEGLFLSAITVYTIEIAPTSSRGRLGTVVQLLITMGIASGYFVCFGTSHVANSFSWRFPFGMQSVVSISLAAGCPFLPHSPRWLHHVGRHDEAHTTWEKLGVSATDVEKIEQAALREQATRPGFATEMKEMWQTGVRGRTALGIFLFAMQNASGIDGVLYYAPVLFSQAGLSGTEASFIASGVTGLVNFLFTILCQFFTDKWGRRSSMIRGGSVIAASMLLIGTLYASGASNRQAGRWAIIVLIYIFVVGFTCSWAIVIRIITSEIQPTRTRAAVSSLGQCVNWVINWVVAFTTPLFLARSSSGPYFLFGSCCLLTTIVCLAFLPETRGSTLEDVAQAFNESPWKSVIENLPFKDALSRRVSISTQREDTPPARNDSDVELTVVHLPEVRFGDPWGRSR